MRRYQLSEYTISYAHPFLPEGTVRLAFFSDLHGCCSPQEQERVLELMAAFAPDLVLCGGDAVVVKTGWDPSEVLTFFTRIAARYPFYTGLGNHEVGWQADPERFPEQYASYTKALCACGVTVLDNECVSVKDLALPLTLCGYSVPDAFYQHFKRAVFVADDLQFLAERPADEALTILLAHHPACLPAAFAQGVDLTLCGHFHGGLIRMGKHHGLLSAELRFFPGNAYGHFQKAGKHGIISSGCGEHTLPARFHNPRELVGITLVNTHQ